MASATHIIHRLVLHIEVPGRNMAQKAQDDAKKYFEEVLLKYLEQLLDTMDIDGHLLIDTLDIDLGTINANEVFLGGFETKFAEAFELATGHLSQPVKRDNTPADATFITGDQQALGIFIHFLQWGQLPWYASSTGNPAQHEDIWLEQICAEIAENEQHKTYLLKLFNRSAVALGRLFSQFSSAFIKKFTTALLPNLSEQEVLQLAKNLVQVHLSDKKTSEPELQKETEVLLFFEKLVLVILLRYYDKQDIILLPGITKFISAIEYKENRSISEIIKIADTMLQLVAETNTSVLPPTQDSAAELLPELSVANNGAKITEDLPSSSPQTEQGGIFVNQAGLVILNPFLEYYFKDFGLIQGNDFADIYSRQLSVHLLHYLATGQVNAFEYDLYFEKFLCCWPLEMPIERSINIPQSMLDEADNMLRTVIKYWKALKNTSPDGLRWGFLQRNGKLIENSDQVQLIVEKKDMDVLLATLPWGIGVVKLHWMQQPFYVQW